MHKDQLLLPMRTATVPVCVPQSRVVAKLVASSSLQVIIDTHSSNSFEGLAMVGHMGKVEPAMHS